MGVVDVNTIAHPERPSERERQGEKARARARESARALKRERIGVVARARARERASARARARKRERIGVVDVYEIALPERALERASELSSRSSFRPHALASGLTH
jgi:hypothetical protein